MFDNAKTYAVFAKDALWVRNMSKKVEKIQSFLYDGWYKKNQQCQIQFIWYSELNSE